MATSENIVKELIDELSKMCELDVDTVSTLEPVLIKVIKKYMTVFSVPVSVDEDNNTKNIAKKVTKKEISLSNMVGLGHKNISRTNIYNINNMTELIGHKVLVFDTETTGLPERRSFDVYYDPKDISKYDKARIIQIAWYYTDSYQPEFDEKFIKCYTRKPTDFGENTFSVEAVKINNITYDKALNEGLTFTQIMHEQGFLDALKNCEFIVAHNALFDMNILLSELYRYGMINIDEVHLKFIVDTLKMGTDICRLPSKNGYYYKPPKLCELYKHFFHTEPQKKHDAKGDIITLLKCMKLM